MAVTSVGGCGCMKSHSEPSLPHFPLASPLPPCHFRFPQASLSVLRPFCPLYPSQFLQAKVWEDLCVCMCVSLMCWTQGQGGGSVPFHLLPPAVTYCNLLKRQVKLLTLLRTNMVWLKVRLWYEQEGPGACFVSEASFIQKLALWLTVCNSRGI